VFPAIVVSTAWVTLLYVVGLAMAATSIGRIRLESLALGWRLMTELGHEQPIQQGILSGGS